LCPAAAELVAAKREREMERGPATATAVAAAAIAAARGRNCAAGDGGREGEVRGKNRSC